jgi:mono/diheme cytochrome c family protein
MRSARIVLAAVVVVVMGVAIAGVGMGDAPKGDPAPTGAQVAASKLRIAHAGSTVAEGRREFETEGCEACHAMAADGRKGVLGPRLDTDTDPAKEIRSAITDPRADIVKGYEPNLMPTDYSKTMTPAELDAVVAYIKATSGEEKKSEEEG